MKTFSRKSVVQSQLLVPPLVYKNNTNNISGVRSYVNNPDWRIVYGQLCMYVCRWVKVLPQGQKKSIWFSNKNSCVSSKQKSSQRKMYQFDLDKRHKREGIHILFDSLTYKSNAQLWWGWMEDSSALPEKAELANWTE